MKEQQPTPASADGAPENDATRSRPAPDATDLDAMRREIAQYRIDQEAALLAQEHRIVAAVRNVAEVLFTRHGPERARLLPPALSALAWCLVPSGGTAAVGLVALLSLLVTFQQSRLLATQNDKIEVQNLLAEAQRRASLVVEITAIFERIDTEKTEATNQRRDCDSPRQRLCFQPTVPDEPQRVFVPSQATLGRIAALTQALRPYRYLTVEGATPELCPQDTASPTLTAAYMALLGEIVGRGPDGARSGLAGERATVLVDAVYREDGTSNEGWLARLFGTASLWIDRLAGSRFTGGVQLNCAPASPERGQLIVALHAAGIDLSLVQVSGGDFTYADIPGASLAGVRLHEVNLTGARLPGANFARADLTGVIFRGADLSNARFANANIRKSDFEGSRVQVYNRDGDAPLFFLPQLSDDNLLSGMRLYQESRNPNIFERVCGTLALARAVPRPSETPSLADNVRDMGLLIETRPAAGERRRQEALLIYDLRLSPVTLHETLGGVRLEYQPFVACPPSRFGGLPGRPTRTLGMLGVPLAQRFIGPLPANSRNVDRTASR